MRTKIVVAIKRAAWIILGIVVICTCIALLNVIQEYISPTYSGFSFWRPMVLLPVTVLFSGFVATLVHVVAALLKWPKLNSPLQLFLVGGICGFSLSGSFFGHLLWIFFAIHINLELLFILTTFVIAIFVRFQLTR